MEQIRHLDLRSEIEIISDFFFISRETNNQTNDGIRTNKYASETDEREQKKSVSNPIN